MEVEIDWGTKKVNAHINEAPSELIDLVPPAPGPGPELERAALDRALSIVNKPMRT